MHTRRCQANTSRARAQNMVEYGLLVAVVMLVFLFGFNLMLSAEAGYLTGSVAKPDPTVIAGLPLHAVKMQGSCNNPPSPVYTGTSFSCSLTLTDLYTGGPTEPPLGAVNFDGSTGSYSACGLQADSSTTSRCTFSYTPTTTRDQVIGGTYVPDSNHLGQTWTLGASVYALDKTHIDSGSSCQPAARGASSVPLGEPAVCRASVVDEFTGSLLPATLTTTAAPAAGWTVSDVQSLQAWDIQSSFQCPIQSNQGCLFLFRSAATAGSTGTYAMTPSFARDADHEASPPVAAMQISVSGPSVHQALLRVWCTDGSVSTSPLRVSLQQNTRCTVQVTDSNPAVNDAYGYLDPTNVIPSGSISLSAQPSNNGAGGFASPTCQLQPLTATASQCNGVYTPTQVGDTDTSGVSTHAANASFSGNPGVYVPTGSPLGASAPVYVTN